MKYCLACGSECADNANFCMECGGQKFGTHEEYAKAHMPFYDEWLTDFMDDSDALDRADEFFEAEDYAHAKLLYQKIAPNYGLACARLGYMYEKGLGMEIDYPRALAYYERGAQLGEEAECALRLGVMHEEGLGVGVNYKTAFQYYEAALRLGESLGEEDEFARFKLGCFYFNGYGVAQDRDKGIAMLRQAASAGYGPALDMLKKFGLTD